MAKSTNKKSAKEASNIFHNIIAAPVKGNPKPKKKKVEIGFTKPDAIIKHIEAEVEMEVQDWRKYSWIQISMCPPYSVDYFIKNECPLDKYNKIEKTIIKQAQLLGIEAEFHG